MITTWTFFAFVAKVAAAVAAYAAAAMCNAMHMQAALFILMHPHKTVQNAKLYLYSAF